MGTNIRPEVSQKNQYYLDRHRYYELKHFCLQYPEWRKAYNDIDGYFGGGVMQISTGKNYKKSRTEIIAEARLHFLNRIRMVECAAKEASPELATYLLVAVTEGYSYEHLKARLEIPCGKDLYYDIYRRFFWILDKARK